MRDKCDPHPSWLEVLGDPIRLRTLIGLTRSRDVTAGELAELITVSEAALRRHLEAMVTMGLAIERAGSSDGLTKGRPASRYELLPEVRVRATRLLELVQEPLAPSSAPSLPPGADR